MSLIYTLNVYKILNHVLKNRLIDFYFIFDIGASNDFAAYRPIIEQVKLTNEELKQIIKMQQKNIAQELKLLQQFSIPESQRSQDIE